MMAEAANQEQANSDSHKQTMTANKHKKAKTAW